MEQTTKRVEILDSTLRDGAQGEGISFSVEDKLAITRRLDKLGVPYVEAGNPGSNPKDLEFFRRAAAMNLQHTQLVAFGSTRRKNIAVEEDANVQALLTADTAAVSLFGKCWDLHVRDILKTTEEENFAMIADTVAFFKRRGKRVIFDADPEYHPQILILHHLKPHVHSHQSWFPSHSLLLFPWFQDDWLLHYPRYQRISYRPDSSYPCQPSALSPDNTFSGLLRSKMAVLPYKIRFHITHANREHLLYAHHSCSYS